MRPAALRWSPLPPARARPRLPPSSCPRQPPLRLISPFSPLRRRPPPVTAANLQALRRGHASMPSRPAEGMPSQDEQADDSPVIALGPPSTSSTPAALTDTGRPSAKPATSGTAEASREQERDRPPSVESLGEQLSERNGSSDATTVRAQGVPSSSPPSPSPRAQQTPAAADEKTFNPAATGDLTSDTSTAAMDATAPSLTSAPTAPRPPRALHPPDWRPPFPLPTDLATILFRLRSLSTSSALLLRSRLHAHLAAAMRALEEGRARVREESVRLVTAGKLVFGQVGGRVNAVTGYDGIERLKEGVRVRELELTALRSTLLESKTAYHLALSSASSAQRELNDLLQRKASWTTTDVERFTALVRADHDASVRVSAAKTEVERLEGEADRAFDGLLQAILTRYHEEQTWSDKLRSLSSYTQLLVLGVNALLFLGAIAVVEPWKRRRMVAGFEERVREMQAEVSERIGMEVVGLKRELEAFRAAATAVPNAQAEAPHSAADILAPSAAAKVEGPSIPAPMATAPRPEPSPPAPSSPLLLPLCELPYYAPSPALSALPHKVLATTRQAVDKALHDERSTERAVGIAAVAGAGVGALVVALFKG